MGWEDGGQKEEKEGEVWLVCNRPEGSESKLNTYSDGFKVLSTIIKLYKDYKPLSFFSVLATVMTIVAAGMFLWVFARFLNSGLVENMPTLVVSGFIELAALQAFFAGMILSDMVTKKRREFEMHLLAINQKKREILAVADRKKRWSK